MLELSVKTREEAGVRNKQIRKEGYVPAVLYGPGVKNLNLTINANDLDKIYKEAGESTLIKLKIKASSKDDHAVQDRVVLIKDMARDPVTDRAIHVDFNQVKMDKEITVEVPLVFIGQSKAVEQDNGVLLKNIQTIEVEALPQELPHEIEVDISVLQTFEDRIYIKDLKVSDKVKLAANSDDMVASVIPPRSEEELEELEETPTESVDEVEVEEKGKIAEEATEEEQPQQSQQSQEENPQ